MASPSRRDLAQEFDIHERIAPAPSSAARDKLRAEGVPAVLRVLIEGIWDRRPVVLFGKDPAASQSLWQALAGVRTREDWVDWLAFARQSAWGKPVPWSKQVEDWSRSEQYHAWGNARELLGAPLADWLQEDGGWMEWWSAAQSRLSDGDDRLERRTRVLDQQRVKSRPDPKASLASPAECSMDVIYEKARILAERFGLRRLEVAGGVPLWCVVEHLEYASQGLADLAQALVWPEKQLGCGHLGLGWELGPKDVAAAYDPRQHMIFLGREEWFGSFVHEFGHALDRVASNPSLPGGFLSIQQSQDVFFEDRPLGYVDLVHARQEIIRGFHAVYREWRAEFPDEHPQLTPLDNALDEWVDTVLDPEQWKVNQRQGWDRWRSRMTLVLTNAPKPWAMRFGKLCELTESLWDDPPVMEGWQAWAMARDAYEGKRYWNQPHEIWARAYHAVIREKMPSSNWAACDTDRSDMFPCRHELDRWIERIKELQPHLEKQWVSRGQCLDLERSRSPV